MNEHQFHAICITYVIAFIFNIRMFDEYVGFGDMYRSSVVWVVLAGFVIFLTTPLIALIFIVCIFVSEGK